MRETGGTGTADTGDEEPAPDPVHRPAAGGPDGSGRGAGRHGGSGRGPAGQGASGPPVTSAAAGAASRPGGTARPPRRPAGLRDSGILRETRGEAALLACLLAVVALLSLVASAGPPLLDRFAGQGLVSRVEAAQQTQAVVRQSAVLEPPEDVRPAPRTSTLGHDLAVAGQQFLRTAKPPLAGALRHASTRVEIPATRTATTEGPVHLGLLYADDAPAVASYVQGRPPGRSAPDGPLQIALSVATRDALRLRLGQSLQLEPQDGRLRSSAVVVGFFAVPSGGTAPLWRQEPLLERPVRTAQTWRAQAVTDATALDLVQQRGQGTLTVTWQSELRLTDAAATPLATDAGLSALSRAATAYGNDSGDRFCPHQDGYPAFGCAIGEHPTDLLTTADDIPQLTAEFAGRRAQARGLELFALAGLVVVGLATVVVVARLAVHRASAAQALRRARGASAADLAFVRLLQTGPTALAGLAAGLGAARLVVPAGTGPGSVLPAVAATAIAGLMLPALTWASLRDRGRGQAPVPARRLTAEAAVLLLCAAGVLALRARGSDGASDPRTAAVPALLGIATVVLLVRVYPLPLRLLTRAARRRRGTVGLIALSRAGREAPGQALALLVLVTTLSTAVFGGLVSRTVTDGRRTAAVRAAGADATVIGAPSAAAPDSALTSLPGVRHALTLRAASTQVTSAGSGIRFDRVRVAALDAKALRTAEPDSAVARALLTAGDGGPGPKGPPLVLPALATGEFGTAAVGDTYASLLGDGDVSFRIVGIVGRDVRQDPVFGPLLADDAAGDAGRGRDPATAPPRPMLLLDASAARLLGAHDYDFSAVLLYGQRLDVGALQVAAARLTGPTGRLLLRTRELAAAQDDGLLRGVQRVYTVSTALAVLLALLALVMELLLTSRARGRTASRLRTLGLPTSGVAALHLLELLPMVLAAVAGGVALGLGLPALLGPALTLRRFTGGLLPPALHTDYALTAALGLGMVAVVAVAVAVETWLGRRRGAGAVLRLGEAA